MEHAHGAGPHDVLVIGAGPAASRPRSNLARFLRSVLVMDDGNGRAVAIRARATCLSTTTSRRACRGGMRWGDMAQGLNQSSVAVGEAAISAAIHFEC
jgi:hypothetical protein